MDDHIPSWQNMRRSNGRQGMDGPLINHVIVDTYLIFNC